jgi:hypothetical protein
VLSLVLNSSKRLPACVLFCANSSATQVMPSTRSASCPSLVGNFELTFEAFRTCFILYQTEWLGTVCLSCFGFGVGSILSCVVVVGCWRAQPRAVQPQGHLIIA